MKVIDFQNFSEMIDYIIENYESIQTDKDAVQANKEALELLKLAVEADKETMISTKQAFDSSKADYDAKYSTSIANLAHSEELHASIIIIKEALQALQEAVNTDRLDVDTKQELVNTTKADFDIKYDDFLDKFARSLEISENMGSIEVLIIELRDILDNGLIDDTQILGHKTYSSKKITNLDDSLKADIATTKNELQGSITALSSNTAEALATKLDITTHNVDKESLNNIIATNKSDTQTSLATKLDKATYESDKPTFATKTELSTKENVGVAQNLIDVLSQNIAEAYLAKSATAADSAKFSNLDLAEFHLRSSANGSKVTSVTGNTIDLSAGDNFVVDMNTAANLTLTNPTIGQSGVIIVTTAANISGYGPNIKFRIVPTGLTTTEVFAYFVVGDTDIRMGRV
ncbi:hypothetical protein [Campylobacter hyointestinalis]|uniref:Uncharacterized protein n=1 Tax=Campylobacter hyointestinalis subsp. hyointestinalis TaxID=91352 RepID=A0A9W5EST6_CAMHY|nr:hypothetical protein [Campylobacter hyointestinalis]CUU74481.1 Uncharacterised protein [Campylobacter hyointestinalis subsp. hyointestinalis]CUU82295.1 Uncharacterised protein [Campylobacter hyointestinalis subsp. hyointestinalis]